MFKHDIEGRIITIKDIKTDVCADYSNAVCKEFVNTEIKVENFCIVKASKRGAMFMNMPCNKIPEMIDLVLTYQNEVHAPIFVITPKWECSSWYRTLIVYVKE